MQLGQPASAGRRFASVHQPQRAYDQRGGIAGILGGCAANGGAGAKKYALLRRVLERLGVHVFGQRLCREGSAAVLLCLDKGLLHQNALRYVMYPYIVPGRVLGEYVHHHHHLQTLLLQMTTKASIKMARPSETRPFSQPSPNIVIAISPGESETEGMHTYSTHQHTQKPATTQVPPSPYSRLHSSSHGTTTKNHRVQLLHHCSDTHPPPLPKPLALISAPAPQAHRLDDDSAQSAQPSLA